MVKMKTCSTAVVAYEYSAMFAFISHVICTLMSAAGFIIKSTDCVQSVPEHSVVCCLQALLVFLNSSVSWHMVQDQWAILEAQTICADLQNKKKYIKVKKSQIKVNGKSTVS